MYKLAVFDLDGTLLNTAHEISVENMKSIEKLKKLGCKIAIATGRSDLLVKEYVRKINLVGPVISCNGAMVRNPLSKERVAIRTLDKEYVREIISTCKRDNHIFMAYAEECIISTLHERVRYFMNRNEKLEEELKAEFIISDDAEYISRNFDVMKILIIEKNSAKYEGIRAKFEQMAELSICQSAKGFIDIMPKNISKKIAIEMIAKNAGITAEEIVAFGDNYNDIEMLEYAGCAVTTENGVDKVKNIADYISSHHDESGVAHAIENFILKKY